MTKSIFVGNLPWSVTDEMLIEKFSEFGTVSKARVIKDKMTNRSKGFGFVEMDEEGFTKAVEVMSEVEWEGRKLTVNEARPQQPRK